MDEDNNIPASTLRVVASLLALALDVARQHATDIVERWVEHVRPVIEPPDDLNIYSDNGTLYTGIILVERGRVIAAVVVMAGHRPAASPLVTPPPRHVDRGRFEQERPRSPFSGITDHFEREGRLPGWADDPRQEDEPWRHR